MSISKETKVGIMAVTAIAMLYFGFNFIKGADVFSSNYQYYAVFDNVGGLQSSNAIKLNGVQVGQVQEVELLQNRGNKVLVILDISKKLRLSKGTQAMLSSELLGGNFIALQIPASGKILGEGDTLMAVTEKGIQALLQEKALPVVKDADSLILNLNRIVKQFDKTGYAINKLLATTDLTAQGVNATIAQNRETLAATLGNVKTLSASLIETEKAFKPILANLTTTTDSLKALQLGRTLAEANVAVASLQRSLLALERGEGTASKLLNDKTMYDNINRTLVSVNKLMTNFRENPKRYVNISVFSRKDKGPTDSPADTTTKY